MQVLEVFCPQCKNMCGVDVEERELGEGVATEGFEVQCTVCECDFRFDVYVEVQNKAIV